MNPAVADLGLLFDTSDFPARWNCGDWTPLHGWTHILADLAIAAAYSAIPLALAGYWWIKRGELVFPRLFWLFAAFIFSCGGTHVVEALLFYHPVYRFSAVMKVLTAVVSWATVVALWRIAPQAIQLPGLQRANAQLEEQLEKNRHAEAALERSNRDLEAFTGLVTHDLKNPLGSAVFTASLAREACERGDAALGASQVALALQSLRQMEALIRELHADALLRRRSGEMADVALDDVLAAARLNLAPLILDRHADLQASRLPVVHGSHTMLVQLFINLFENAIKYAGDDPPRIRVEASVQPDGAVTIFVADGGMGIPPEDRERVFEPGSRGGNASHLPGSGLGLAFGRRIMQAHGGSLVALPAEKGATLELRFPPRDAQA
jgi:signal transduction histidine kinase